MEAVFDILRANAETHQHRLYDVSDPGIKCIRFRYAPLAISELFRHIVKDLNESSEIEFMDHINSWAKAIREQMDRATEHRITTVYQAKCIFNVMRTEINRLVFKKNLLGITNETNLIQFVKWAVKVETACIEHIQQNSL